MSVFAAYARYYDLLYRDKDYAAEADYVARKLREHGSSSGSILELGCGTGAHAYLLAQRGFTVHGVDVSGEMLAAAQRRVASAPAEIGSMLRFSRADVRSVRLDTTFDAVISLFHVFSYQTRDEDLRAALETAKAHLRPGGTLLFDCWFGPAVLTLRPAITVKRLEDDALHVTRIAEPVVDLNENVVTVNYDVIVSEKTNGAMHRLSESHRMRYLFSPEVKSMCADAGLEVIEVLRWLGDDLPDAGTWAACFVARG